MEKIETIYYDNNYQIMFKEMNFVFEAPEQGDWIEWHTKSWIVQRRVFNFDLKRLEIHCLED